MNDILKDLLKTIEEVEKLDTVEFRGKQIRMSQQDILLPCNEKGELIGLDAEVINFHAKRWDMPVRKSRWIPVGDFYMVQRPKPITWMFTESA